MTSSKPTISIVLPAYNEEDNIGDTVKAILSYGRQNQFSFEIIVVNDGSADRTPVIVQEIQKTNPEVKLVNHEHNKGYGEALRSGFDAASKDWIFLMDSDGQFNITELDTFLPHTENNDMIIGFREHRADAWHRVLYGWGYTLLMNLFFNMRYKDIDCAFKLFRRSAWKKVQPIKSTDHKIFTVEWLWKTKKADITIKELPVHHYPRTKGTQTGARLDVVWQMIKSLIKLRIQN